MRLAGPSLLTAPESVSARVVCLCRFVLMLKMLLHFVVSGQMSDLTAAEVEARAESSRPPAGRSAQRGASKRR